jgi:hypothetical protein
MADPDERKQMGTTAGVHHWLGQSGAAAPERVFGGRESHFASPSARKVKIFEGAETMGDILTRRTAAG